MNIRHDSEKSKHKIFSLVFSFNFRTIFLPSEEKCSEEKSEGEKAKPYLRDWVLPDLSPIFRKHTKSLLNYNIGYRFVYLVKFCKSDFSYGNRSRYQFAILYKRNFSMITGLCGDSFDKRHFIPLPAHRSFAIRKPLSKFNFVAASSLCCQPSHRLGLQAASSSSSAFLCFYCRLNRHLQLPPLNVATFFCSVNH